MEQKIQPGQSVTVAITEAVCALENRPPATLQPLHNVIGNDLDEIFGFDESNHQIGQHLCLTFEYMDYYISIENDATLSIERKPEKPFAV